MCSGKSIATITTYLVLNSIMLFAILSGYKDMYTVAALLITNIVLLYNMLTALLKSCKKEK